MSDPVASGGAVAVHPARPPNVPPPADADFADWGRRFAAWLIDVIIVSAVATTILITASVLIESGGDDLSAGGAVALVFSTLCASFFGYAWLLMRREGRRNGQTLGKQALGITVRRTDGRPIGAGTVALRELLLKYIVFYQLAILTLYLLTLLNYLWPAWDREHRALHDFVMSTRVVRV